MSGPVTSEDVAPTAEEGADVRPPCVELTDSHEATVGNHQVRRALPRRTRRTVGPWCFADHIGPASVTERAGLDVGPHPHIGLQTVTWLVEGEVLHRDSLGSEQVIRPGQLNLMTAGQGVSHSEEATGTYRGPLHGIQLWVAQPEATRFGPPAFEHHAELPAVELDGGRATVLIGELAGTASPARRDTDHLGLDVALDEGRSIVPVQRDHEYALIVLSGRVTIGGMVVTPGHLAYLGEGRDELPLDADEASRVIVLGGRPFEARILMWWNYVARARDEVDEAHATWRAGGARFGTVASTLPRIDGPAGTPWPRSSPSQITDGLG